MTTKPKHTSTKVILLAVLVLAGMIVSPASAYIKTMEIGMIEDPSLIVQNNFEGVYDLYFNSTESGTFYSAAPQLPIDTRVDYTIYYGNGLSMSGFLNYTLLGPAYSIRAISLDDQEATHNFVDYFQFLPDKDVITYGANITGDEVDHPGFVVYNPGTIGPNILVFKEVSSGDLITAIEMSSNNPIDVLLLSAPADIVIKDRDFTRVDDSAWNVAQKIIDFATGLIDVVLNFAIALFYWLKFFFIDNLVMTISLYVSISAAYTANTAKDIFKFIGKFFKDQIALFNFILSLWRALVEIISSFRGIFRL